MQVLRGHQLPLTKNTRTWEKGTELTPCPLETRLHQSLARRMWQGANHSRSGPSSRSLPGARALRRLFDSGRSRRGGRAVTRWKLGSRSFRGTSLSRAHASHQAPAEDTQDNETRQAHASIGSSHGASLQWGTGALLVDHPWISVVESCWVHTPYCVLRPCCVLYLATWIFVGMTVRYDVGLELKG